MRCFHLLTVSSKEPLHQCRYNTMSCSTIFVIIKSASRPVRDFCVEVFKM